MRDINAFIPGFCGVFLGVLLLVSGCSFFPAPVKVGVVGALSGTGADLGVQGRNGFQMVFTPSRLKYGIDGRSVEILYRDDRGDPNTALDIYRELEAQGCRIVISFQTSGAAEKAFEYARSQDMVVLSATASAAKWEGVEDRIFRLMATTSRQGELLAVLASQEGHRKALSIGSYQNRAYSQSVIQGFSGQFTKGGGQVQQALYLEDSKPADLAKLAQEIRQSGAEVLAPLCLSTPDTAALALQMEKLGLRIPVYLSAWSLSGDLESLAGPALEGFSAVSFMNYYSPLPQYAKFREAYRSVHSQEPHFPALLGYETGKMLDYIFSHTMDLTPEGIKESLLRKATFEGLQAPVTLDAYGDFHRPLFLYRFVSGRWQIIRS